MMPVTYKNRRNKTYYLHLGKTKTGKPRYYFSKKRDGELLDEIPEGYEIYEHPAIGLVFLRKKLPQLITDLEKHIVERELKSAKTSKRYLVDIKKEDITIFESNKDFDELKEFSGSKFPFNDASFLDDILPCSGEYIPIMRFILQDENKRNFIGGR